MAAPAASLSTPMVCVCICESSHCWCWCVNLSLCVVRTSWRTGLTCSILTGGFLESRSWGRRLAAKSHLWVHAWRLLEWPHACTHARTHTCTHTCISTQSHATSCHGNKHWSHVYIYIYTQWAYQQLHYVAPHSWPDCQLTTNQVGNAQLNNTLSACQFWGW